MNVPSRHATRQTAEKKALLIGIEYGSGQPSDVGAIEGVTEDLEKVKRVLVTSWSYLDGDVKIMSEYLQDESMRPTKANMLRELKALVSNAKPGDVRLFCFAGHSSQIRDVNGDEEDGKDEVILPSDNCGFPLDEKSEPLDPSVPLPEDVRKKIDAVIVDDELNEILVAQLQRGVKLIALFDSCTSGTLLDLKHYWSPANPRVKSPPKTGEISKQSRRKPKRRNNTCHVEPTTVGRGDYISRSGTYPPPDRHSTLARLFDLGGRLCSTTRVDEESPARVISIACTEDSETAWTAPGMSLVSAVLELVEEPGTRKFTWKQFMCRLTQRMNAVRLLRYAKYLKSKNRKLTKEEIENMENISHPQLGSEAPSMFKDFVGI